MKPQSFVSIHGFHPSLSFRPAGIRVHPCRSVVAPREALSRRLPASGTLNSKTGRFGEALSALSAESAVNLGEFPNAFGRRGSGMVRGRRTPATDKPYLSASICG